MWRLYWEEQLHQITSKFWLQTGIDSRWRQPAFLSQKTIGTFFDADGGNFSAGGSGDYGGITTGNSGGSGFGSSGVTISLGSDDPGLPGFSNLSGSFSGGFSDIGIPTESQNNVSLPHVSSTGLDAWNTSVNHLAFTPILGTPASPASGAASVAPRASSATPTQGGPNSTINPDSQAAWMPLVANYLRMAQGNLAVASQLAINARGGDSFNLPKRNADHFLEAARDAQNFQFGQPFGQPGWFFSQLDNNGYEGIKFGVYNIFGASVLSLMGDPSIPSANEYNAGELGADFGSFYQNGSFK